MENLIGKLHNAILSQELGFKKKKKINIICIRSHKIIDNNICTYIYICNSCLLVIAKLVLSWENYFWIKPNAQFIWKKKTKTKQSLDFSKVSLVYQLIRRRTDKFFENITNSCLLKMDNFWNENTYFRQSDNVTIKMRK